MGNDLTILILSRDSGRPDSLGESSMGKIILLMLMIESMVWVAAGAGNYARHMTTDQQVKYYQKLMQTSPDNIRIMNELAGAYIQKFRETADPSYNALAEKLLAQALSVESDNYDALVYLALLQMSQHRFSESRFTALKASRINPDDSIAFGILGDACYELGFYQECEEAYQRMNDLRPGTASYSRAAIYRRLVGDWEGAIELMDKALQAADYQNSENRAWCFLQMGNYYFATGKLNEAEQYYSHSIESFPSYYHAIAGLAKVKAARGRLKEAIALYIQAIAIVPSLELIVSLGDIYVSLGNPEEAEKQFQLVEYIGLVNKANQEKYNRQMALFYADHDRKLDDALALAEAEIAVRQDIYGYDALAWCLYKKGKYVEAMAAMKEGLKMDTRDATLFFHAGMIYEKLSQPLEAERYLEAALKTNPNFHTVFAGVAQETLKRIRTQVASS